VPGALFSLNRVAPLQSKGHQIRKPVICPHCRSLAGIKDSCRQTHLPPEVPSAGRDGNTACDIGYHLMELLRQVNSPGRVNCNKSNKVSYLMDSQNILVESKLLRQKPPPGLSNQRAHATDTIHLACCCRGSMP
jgi:hypothetical protein